MASVRLHPVYIVLLFYIASIPLFSLRTDLFVITWAFGLVVALFYGIAIVQHGGRVQVRWPYFFLLLWLLLGCISLLIKGLDLSDGIVRARSVALNVGMMIVISDLVGRGGERLFRWIVATYGLSSLVAFVIGMFSAGTGNIFSARFDAGFYNPNQTSFIFATAAVGFLFFLLTSKKMMVRVVSAVATLVTVLGVLLTGSRQGLVALITGGVVLLMFERRRMKILPVVAVLAVAALPAVQSIEVDGGLIIERRVQRFFQFFEGDYDSDTSALTRLELIKAGWRMFQDHPIIGVGLNQYRHYVVNFGGPRNTYAHNNYIEVLASTGLLGFVLYYGVVFATCWKAYRQRHVSDSHLLILAFLCMLLVGDLFRVSYYQRIETTLLALAIGVQFSRSPNYQRLASYTGVKFRPGLVCVVEGGRGPQHCRLR